MDADRIRNRPVNIPQTATPGTTIDRAATSSTPIDTVEIDAPSMMLLEIRAAASAYRNQPPTIRPMNELGATLSDFADQLESGVTALGAEVDRIRDHQRVLTHAKAAIKQNAIPYVRDLIDAARESLELAESTTIPKQREAYLAEAQARLQSAAMLLAVESIEVAYLGVVDQGEDLGVPSQMSVQIPGAMNRELMPIVDAASTMNPELMAAALNEHAEALAHAREFLPIWAQKIGVGAEFSAKAIAALDAAMIIFSIYEGGRALGGFLSNLSTGGPGFGGFTRRRRDHERDESGGHRRSARELTQAGPARCDRERRAVRWNRWHADRTTRDSSADVDGHALGRGDTSEGPTHRTRGPLRRSAQQAHAGRRAHAERAPRSDPQSRERTRKFARVCGGDQARRNAAKKYGGQLSKEGVARYEQLIRDAVENGTEKSGKFYRQASSNIGIEVKNGEPTPYYRVDGAPHGAHIIPIAKSEMK